MPPTIKRRLVQRHLMMTKSEMLKARSRSRTATFGFDIRVSSRSERLKIQINASSVASANASCMRAGTCESALSRFFSGLWRKLGATARRKVTDRSESDGSITYQRAMAVDAATLEKETLQWPLTRRHRKKKSHNGRRRGHIDKRNLTMATVCLAMGVVRLSMALEMAPWLWKRVRGSWKLNYGNFTFQLRTRRRR